MRRLLPLLVTPGLLAGPPRHSCPRRLLAPVSSCPAMRKTLAEWSFSSPALSELPTVLETANVRGAVFSLGRPTPWRSPPEVVCSSKEALALLDLAPGVAETREFADWAGGQTVLAGSQPLAHRYGGHQFGHWAGQLGDGRAHLLGEYTSGAGQRWEVQLKGSGRTPYSRFGDGRAVLRSSIREFLCSEAMAGLGVPSSRAASLAVTEDRVARDMFYDGRQRMERGAVVLRLAPTWFRFGSLEILAINNEKAELKQLADFILKQTFPHIGETEQDGYIAMFREIVTKTAELISHWTAVGFAHGVLNTDNMSIASITIDYGPFGFVDGYRPDFTPNHSDDMGRYDLQSQPSIGLWNLDKLATALKPLLDQERHVELETALRGYTATYQSHLLGLWRAKLGLRREEAGDEALVDLLLQTMEVVEADFTQTFRDLGELGLEDLREGRVPVAAWGLAQCMKNKEMKKFIALYTARLAAAWTEDAERMEAMQAANPRYVLRNWVAQRAIELAEEGDYSEVQFVHQLLLRPYTTDPAAEEKGYARPPPKWAGQLAVSCSS
jgi:uncharacterized protein YdiU (UPF0061 family)